MIIWDRGNAHGKSNSKDVFLNVTYFVKRRLFSGLVLLPGELLHTP